MLQFYFLSIVTNILAGMALSIDYLEEKFSGLSTTKEFFTNQTFRFVLGAITFIVGILKLLSATRGDIPVVGDLFPALIGLVMGVTLLIEYYRSKSEISSAGVDTLENMFVRRKTTIGILGIIFGILHFLMPGVLLL